ncbi:MAG: hypothetical protein N7Q72_02615, partial [Spiroplasma sp. Tabriz.8]|nr:hypothetical protein [Spiroplasma sp. Tabriz.8]
KYNSFHLILGLKNNTNPIVFIFLYEEIFKIKIFYTSHPSLLLLLLLLLLLFWLKSIFYYY